MSTPAPHPLHIGTITYDWYPAHPRVRRMAEAAIDAGYVVDVICLRQPGEKRFEVYNEVHVYRVPLNRSLDGPFAKTLLGWCRFILLAGATVTWLHLKRPYQVIHVHNLPDILVLATLIPRLLKARIILDVQDTSPELMAEKVQGRLRPLATRMATWQERFSAAFAHHVVTVGWPFEQLLLKRGVSAHKLTCILNSADPSIFPPERRAPIFSTSVSDAQPFILLYHGTVCERQGLDTAIRAIALAHHEVPQVQLHIKGFGDQLVAIKALAEELGISDRVVFSDFCPVGEVADFIAHGDAGIIPYRSGGFMELLLPAKAYEFAWMHCPMIASDLLGLRSMFRPESVIFCDPDSPESFAAAIIELAKYPGKRAALAANAAQDYIPFRWEQQAQRYQHLLAQLGYSMKEPAEQEWPQTTSSTSSL